MTDGGAFMKHRLFLFAVSLLMTCAFIAGCSSSTANSGGTHSDAALSKTVTIRMLDAGQGDAILIDTGAEVVLIDTSDVDERKLFMGALEKAGINKVDKLILTHAHADHIGGAEPLMKKYQVGAIYDNGIASTSKLFTGYRKMAKEKGIPVTALKAGDRLDLGNGVSFKVLGPSADRVKAENQRVKKNSKDDAPSPNNDSIVGMLQCGDFRMLFTGDAEAVMEKKYVAEYGDELSADVLKSPHHGSKTSSCLEFLKTVSPAYVVISLGKGNDYGHPHKEPLKRYAKLGAEVLETDINGTITITTDGRDYQIEGER